MSNPSLRVGVGAVRILDAVRTAKSVTRSYFILKRSSSGSVYDIAARSSPRLSTHASKEYRLSLGLRLSRPIYAHPAQSFCVDVRDSRKRPLERRWLSNKVTESDNDSLEGNSRKSRSCWKCMSTVRVRDFFCKCGAAQLLDERLDYFEMFDKTPAVLMDVSDVENRFKKMQRIFHPVSFALICIIAHGGYRLFCLKVICLVHTWRLKHVGGTVTHYHRESKFYVETMKCSVFRSSNLPRA